MQRAWVVARQHRRRWLWGGFMLLLTNAAAMTIPQLFRFGLDGVRAGAPVDELTRIAGVLVVLAAGGAVFRTLSRLHLFYAARDLELGLRSDYFRHLSRLEPAFFARHRVGDLMSRATNDLGQVRLMFGAGLLNVLNTAMAYTIALPLMLALSVKLTLLTLAVYPLGFLLMRHFGRRVFAESTRQQVTLGKIADAVQETLSGAQVVRAFGLERERQAVLAALSQRYFEEGVKLVSTRAVMSRLVLAIANSGVLLAVIFGARDAMQERLSVGELVAMIEYMALLAWPTFALGWVITSWQRGLAALARLEEVMAVSPRIVSGPEKPVVIVPSLEARGLSVELGGQKVLDDVSFQVPPGAVLGVVGPIGSGKTTLLAALMRLLEVQRGKVLVGGHDVTALDLGVLRAAFGYVPQGHTLFSLPLRDNVAFGRPDATDDEVRAALKDAAFDADLQALPEGLDTPIGERGITLSGGQKQRVAIARALLIDPPILLLDDALSSIDAETEAALLDRLSHARSGRTTVIVAHRVSAVRAADEILVLDEGRVVERGRHEALLLAGGWYAEVARRQEMEERAEGARVEEGA